MNVDLRDLHQVYKTFLQITLKDSWYQVTTPFERKSNLCRVSTSAAQLICLCNKDLCNHKLKSVSRNDLSVLFLLVLYSEYQITSTSKSKKSWHRCRYLVECCSWCTKINFHQLSIFFFFFKKQSFFGIDIFSFYKCIWLLYERRSFCLH